MPRRATLRLQLHKAFSLAAAREHVDYARRLGVSHFYLSPITTARPGSTHGYDVLDPTRVNPELGGETELCALSADLRRAGMGLVIDIVPNHMAVVGANPYWRDVLAHGPGSAYASFFDIDWRPAEATLRDKVLLPFLGRPFEEAMKGGDIAVRIGAEDVGTIAVGEHEFPIRSEDWGWIASAGADAFNADSPTARALLRRLLDQQHYRLAWWRSAGDLINWRRFFDVNELACLRAEESEVFEETHRLVFRLYEGGVIDGVRVDHVDGLADPGGYCRKLRARLDALADKRPADAPSDRAYIVVEKILARDETVPRSWQVDGTTGYDFMNESTAVLHDPRATRSFDRDWRRLSTRVGSFDDEERTARRFILENTFGAQFEAVAQAVFEVLTRKTETLDCGRPAVRRVLVALLLEFRSYRAYPEADADESRLKYAAQRAAKALAPADLSLLDVVVQTLSQTRNSDAAAAIARFQQLSAPLAAKAVEDTAFYRYGRLISRNDVGSDAERLGAKPAQFHAAILRRAKDHPFSMTATATHDHKRGEDVRARLAVLTERPGEWSAALTGFLTKARDAMRAGAGIVSAGDQIFFFQTIVGAWPVAWERDVAAIPQLELEDYRDRLIEWQRKAIREAKLRTSWTVNDGRYESACAAFVAGAFESSALLNDIARFAGSIARAGAVNGLAQTLLKCAVPGAPDIYQGTEFWDQSLVDPDNRRPVGWAAREKLLKERDRADDLLAHWRNGRVKQATLARALGARSEAPGLFLEGAYRPLTLRGRMGDHIVAFAREHDKAQAIAIAPRLPGRLLGGGDALRFAAGAWGDAQLDTKWGTGSWRCAFTGEIVKADNGRIDLGETFARWPVALLMRE